jgi:hypothetical protein
LDELDDDLLHELNEVARENQLAYLPFARSGRAEALLFEQYPELAERIERGKRAKVDAIVLSNKYASADTPSASFRAQSLEEVSASPLRQRNRRRASNQTKNEAKSPTLTPQLKGKSSAADLMFEMSDGEGEDEERTNNIKPPRFTSGQEKPGEQVIGTPQSPWAISVRHKVPGTMEDGFISPSSLPPSAVSGNRTPSQPWGTAPLASAKLDLKDIMAQTSSDQPSGLALGLAKEERERARAAQPKMSQKERKRLQQAELQGVKVEAAQPAPPTVSPWQAASSYRKPSANQIFAPSAATSPPQQPLSQPSPQPARTTSTPQLTMRQTIAKGKGKGKDKEAGGQDASSPSRPAASERGMSVSNTPIPVPMSVRHIPLPSHSPTSPSQHLSMMEILSLQEAEKTSIRDAAAKRSLEEIQQEQEFQQWWEAESKRAIEEEEQAKRAAERATRAAAKGRSKGRGGGTTSAAGETQPANRRDSKKDRKPAEENKKDTKKSEMANETQRKDRTPKPRTPKPKPQPQAPAVDATAARAPNPEAPAFVPPVGPKADQSANGGRGRGRVGHHRGARGVGGARGGRPPAPTRDVQSAPAAPAQHA